MIEPRELRIGNWVEYHDFVNEKTIYCQIEGIHGYVWVSRLEDDYVKQSTGNIHPIPITPEVLGKCECSPYSEKLFELYHSGEDGENRINEILLVGSILEYDLLNRRCYYGDMMIDGVEFLHHLQNLIHAIEGIELNFKP